MTQSIRVSLLVPGAAALIFTVGFLTAVGPANAVVYCRAVGVPHGCVARPAGAAVVTHPAVTHGPVVYCKRVGYPKGCVAR
jgi:hypothetical protein